MRMHTQALVVLITLLATTCVTAQSRGWSGVVYISDDGGATISQDAETDQLKWRWTDVGSGTGSVTMPFDRAGSICVRTDNSVLVAGVAASTGLCSIVELDFPPGAGAPQSTTCFTGYGVDFTSMHFDSATNSLFVHDEASWTVSVASLQGGMLGPRAMIADQSNCALLRSDCPYPTELLPLPSGAAGVHVSPLRGSISAPEYEITMTGSGWTLAVLAAPHLVLPPVWVTEPRPDLSANHDAYLIKVSGGQGPFGVIDADTAQVLFVADHDQPAEVLQVFELPVASAPYGAQVFLRSLAGQPTADSAFIRLQPEWQRESMPVSQLQGGQVLMRWDFPSVGTDLAAWSLRWVDPTPPPSGSFAITMILGDWQFGQSPTMPVGGLDILANQFGDLGTQLVTFGPDRVAQVGASITTDNPALSGARVALQAIGITDASGLFCSDVLGVVLD